MILLVSGATVDVRQTDPARVGVLFQPRNRNSDPAQTDGRVWAVDNDAFVQFDANAFIDLLVRLRGRPGCLWVAAPDVPYDAGATLRAFRTWEPMLHALGFPVALVAQDGLRLADVPWASLDAVFIGGTTRYKLSAEVDSLLGVAQARGKRTHVGRVNSRPRVAHFWRLAETVDGSGFSRWPKRIALFLAWTDALQGTPPRRWSQPRFREWAALPS